jgi:hypothetical protein
MLCNRSAFNSENLLKLRATPKVEDHPTSAVRDCSFTRSYPPSLEILSSFRNLRMLRAEVKKDTHNVDDFLSMYILYLVQLIYFVTKP